MSSPTNPPDDPTVDGDRDTNALPDNVIQFPFGAASSPDADEAIAEAPPELPELTEGVQTDSDNLLGQFTRMIDQGLTSVLVNSWVQGVSLPRELMNQARLLLNWSYRFHLPDFEFDEVGIRGTLSFASGDHFVQLPWASIYVMFLKNGDAWAYWPERTPDELRPFLPQILKGLGLPDR